LANRGCEMGGGVGEECQIVGSGGWADLLQRGVAGGPWGLWGRPWGPWGERWDL